MQSRSSTKTTDWHAWVRHWWVEVAVDARLALFVYVDCRGARRFRGQDAQSWVQDYCCLLCWQASEEQLVCFRTEGPNDGSISTERWWVARSEFGFVGVDVRWTGCVKAAVECTSHSL